MMMHVWEHNFLLFRGFLRVKWRCMEAECGGPPPEDQSDTVLVRQPRACTGMLVARTARTWRGQSMRRTPAELGAPNLWRVAADDA